MAGPWGLRDAQGSGKPLRALIEARSNTSERVLLVGSYDGQAVSDPDRMLDELEGLVRAAGGRAVARTFQRQRSGSVSPSTFIGRGKAKHVAELAEAHEADLVVFDNELSPAQIRELEKLVCIRVIDRSELILDIFAARARTRESRLQVELAQLEYTAPRLRGMWSHLERQAGTGGAGGLGTRGPGEKQIEIDRRLVGDRITRLKRELAQIHKRRQRTVAKRGQTQFCVGLVGYTNAGKSTLLNAVTGAGTYVADQLFATLDTRTRQWTVQPGLTVLLSDTVGFVRDLPHYLVASFRTTLEEAIQADLLVHVVDAAHPDAEEQADTVRHVLKELGVDLSRVVAALNKVDEAPPDAVAVLRAKFSRSVVISARDGIGLDDFSAVVSEAALGHAVRVQVRVPAGGGKVVSFAHDSTHIVSQEYEDSEWVATLVVPRTRMGVLKSIVSHAGGTLTLEPQ